MRYTWANTILLILLPVQIITGFWGLITGVERFAWILWLHSAVGYAVVVILFWKGAVIVDTLKRRRLRQKSTLAFLGLALLLLTILATGIIWTHAGPRYLGGFSFMTIHGLLTVLLATLLLWHVLARRFVLRIPAARDRRAFLRLVGVSLAGLVVWGLTDRVKAAANLPGANRRFTGSYERGSLTGLFPAVTWLFDYPRPVDPIRWRLVIEGAVSRPLTFTYDDLTQLGIDTITATLDCTGGWYSTQAWRGVRLGHLLHQAELTSEARSITVEAVSGYSRRFALDQASDFLLALDVAGQPLSHGHGFPLRLVAPNQRGFVWVKWVARIRVNKTSHIWQLPVPLR